MTQNSAEAQSKGGTPISVVGHLGADAAAGKFPDGSPVVNLRVAVNDSKGATTWYEVSASGEAKMDLLTKGTKVSVRGYVSDGSYKNEAGEVVATKKIKAMEVSKVETAFVYRKQSAAEEAAHAGASTSSAPAEESSGGPEFAM